MKSSTPDHESIFEVTWNPEERDIRRIYEAEMKRKASPRILGFSGIAFVALGILSLWDKFIGPGQTVLFILAGIGCLIFRQIFKLTYYRRTLNGYSSRNLRYVFSPSNISVHIGELYKISVSWKAVIKVEEFSGLIYLHYSGIPEATVFSRNLLGNNYRHFLHLLQINEINHFH